MYNGVGLSTVRGSGTSGYVQKNLSYVKAQQVVRRTEHAHLAERFEKGEEQRRLLQSKMNTATDTAIVQHELKRRVELKVAELREKLTQSAIEKKKESLVSSALITALTTEEENEIEEKVSLVRIKLLADLNTQKEVNSTVSDVSGGVVVPLQKKSIDLKKVRDAIGITDSFVPGQAFDRAKQEELKLERIAKREAEQREKMSMFDDKRGDAVSTEESKRVSSTTLFSDSVQSLLSNATRDGENESIKILDMDVTGHSHKKEQKVGQIEKGISRKRSRSRSASSYTGSSYSSYTGSSYYSYSGSSRSSYSSYSDSDSEDDHSKRRDNFEEKDRRQRRISQSRDRIRHRDRSQSRDNKRSRNLSRSRSRSRSLDRKDKWHSAVAHQTRKEERSQSR
jgi:hypothetical protein